MIEAYFIRDWIENYEVNSKGKVAKPEEELRVAPLPYVRLKVNGHSQRPGYRRIEQLARSKPRLEGVWAVWTKLLEIAANQVRRYRGWILTDRQEPATAKDIAFFTGFREKIIQMALELLSSSEVAWIELRPFELDCVGSPGVPGISAEVSGIPEEGAEAFNNENENRTDTQTESLTKTDTDTEPQTKPSDSAFLSKVSGESDRSSEIQSGSGNNSKKLSPELFAQQVALKLNLSTDDRRQCQADIRCFCVAAERHIVPGHLGDPKEAAERCYTKARELSKSRTVHQKNRAKVWVAWLKNWLKKEEYRWEDT